MNDRQPDRQSAATQVQTLPAKQESEFQRLLNQPHRGTCEYVPYGAQDKIKLTVPIIQNLIAVPTKSGKTCSERDAIKFLAMCQAKRMNPFEGDCYLIGYDSKDGPTFSMITAHQTYLKRAELHPEFDGMRSGIIVREEDGTLKDLEGDFYESGQEVVGGWATVLFKNRKQEMHKRLRLSRFQKSFGVWQDDSAGMICKCAEADALRSSFPTMLGGLYLREEMVGPDPSFASPKFETPKKPDMFKSEKATDLSAPQSEPVVEPVSDKQPESERSSSNPLKALRDLCKLGKIKEGELLDYWQSSGVTDGSATSLEEVQMNAPEVITATYNNWAKTEEAIKTQRASQK